MPCCVNKSCVLSGCSRFHGYWRGSLQRPHSLLLPGQVLAVRRRNFGSFPCVKAPSLFTTAVTCHHKFILQLCCFSDKSLFDSNTPQYTFGHFSGEFLAYKQVMPVTLLWCLMWQIENIMSFVFRMYCLWLACVFKCFVSMQKIFYNQILEEAKCPNRHRGNSCFLRN